MEASKPILRAAFESTGSTNWIMQGIKQTGLDYKNGFDLQVTLLDDQIHSGMMAGEKALSEGLVDFIDTDWLSLARHRQEEKQFVGVYPYGAILGGVVTQTDSKWQGLESLKTARMGVVSLKDKNFVILKQVCQDIYGFDLEQIAELKVTGSKTKNLQLLQSGELDAALLYWHQVPLALESGFKQMVDVLDLLPHLGYSEFPTTFFVFHQEFVKTHKKVLCGFIQAFQEIIQLFQSNSGLWEAVVFSLIKRHSSEYASQLRQSWQRRMNHDWNHNVLTQLNQFYHQLSGPKAEKIPIGTWAFDWFQSRENK